jgi:hypothetical protein
MAPFSVEDDLKSVSSGRHMPGTDSYLSDRQIRGDVSTVHDIDTIEAAGFDHRFGSTRREFFGKLMQEHDVSWQLVTHFAQDLCYTQQSSGVNVVPASVHDTGDSGLVLYLFFILDGQGVKIGTKRDRFPWLATAKQSYDTHATYAGLDLNAE